MDKHIFKLFCWAAGLLVFSAVLLSNGCSMKATGKATLEIPEESAKVPEVYFCPRSDCGQAVEALIASASSSVHCAFYDLDLKNIADALQNKSKTAEVRLVLEKSNFENQAKIGLTRLDGNPASMHNKFCVIDGAVTATGSFNPTFNDNKKNNNNIVIIYSRNVAKNYEDEFDELWNGKKDEKTKNPVMKINSMPVENYFCPEDMCASRVAELLEGAKSSVYFMAFSFTNEHIADVLIRKDGIDIRGIFDSGQASSAYSQLDRLKDFGIDVKKDSNKYKLHHKVFIIDNKTVVTGSFNPTLNADKHNDENIIVLHDNEIAQSFLEEFDRLWQ